MAIVLHATPDELTVARLAGYNAYFANESRAPSLSGTVRDLLGSMPVGSPRTRELFMAYTDGFDEAADQWMKEQLG